MDKERSLHERTKQHHEFLERLNKNELEIPNEFTEEMGKLIKKAREEKGFNQSQLAEKLSRSQATISDIENGKIEIGILTLVQIAMVFHKPISYFIPDMTFLINLTDTHNKWEEEALSIFRDIGSWGDPQLTLKLLKSLAEYFLDVREEEMENS